MLLPGVLPAQEDAGPEADPPAAAKPFGGNLVTVHGVVRNGATGEPIARALVRIEGDAATGALTDGEGRFEIPNLAAGPQLFEVVKPGYLDRPSSAATNMMDDAIGTPHNVVVTAEMAELAFTLSPTCSVHGQVQLSTGDPAQGIEVMLLRRGVQDGRGTWQAANAARTLSDGSYRFAGLADGFYAVYTNPAMDADSAASLVAPGRAGSVPREGYASVFYPDAHDLAGAAKIRLANGEQAQANINLTLEAFHPVTATAVFPGAKGASGASGDDRAGMNYAATVTDAQGHQLPYSAQFDPATNTIQAMLPDGTYSLQLTATARFVPMRFSNGVVRSFPLTQAPQVGSVEFTVAGHPVSNLRIPLSAPHTGTVELTVLHNASSAPSQNTSERNIVVTLSQTGGWLADGVSSNFAQASGPGPMDTLFTPPGTYWVHTHLSQRDLCAASFTAGGADLAREPLVLSLSGSSAPMELTVRDDCATLTLTLPAALSALAAGEEPFYTVYVVPDFDSTVDVEPVTLRPTSGAKVTLIGLTPGSYHVYAFPSPVALEYRNRDVLASLPEPGQAIALSPGSTATLVVEAPGH